MVKKLSPRYIGPYQIIKKIGPVTYHIALPPRLSNIHPVLHVSQLRKYVHDPSHIITEEPLQVARDLTYHPRPSMIVGNDTKQLRQKSIPLVKVIWEGLTPEEATWKLEDDMRQKYPELFQQGKFFFINFKGEILFKRGRNVTSRNICVCVLGFSN